ncbi:glycosyltransferase [bacterium]|nr:glycosyltransferase [bacterium]
MNILMLHPHDIYSNSEPWTVRITYLATEFVKRGHNVRLMYHLIDPRLDLKDATARQEYPFVTIPCYRHQMALIGKMRSVMEFARWADVIHFQKCFPHVSVPALWAGYRLGKPVHYDWDDWEFGIYNYNPMNRLVGASIETFERVLPRMADSVSVASEALRKMAIERGVPEARIFDGHVGADIDRFRPDIDGSRVREEHHIEGPIVLYLGQLHGAQYAELFLQAAKLVLDRGENPTFLVVGGGERFGELFQLAENYGVGHRVIFTGSVDHEVIPEYVAAADVAVACFADTPQVATKSPLKVCEYLASGKAIVASNVGEVPRMIGDAGVLVPAGDAPALADGIVQLLANKELRVRLSAKARQRAETEFNWGVTAENLLRAYDMILHETRLLYWKTGKDARSRSPFLVTPSGAPRGIPTSKWVKPPAAKTETAPIPAAKADPKKSGGGNGVPRGSTGGNGNGNGSREFVASAPAARPEKVDAKSASDAPGDGEKVPEGFVPVQFVTTKIKTSDAGGLAVATSETTAIPARETTPDAPSVHDEEKPRPSRLANGNGKSNGNGSARVPNGNGAANGKSTSNGSANGNDPNGGGENDPGTNGNAAKKRVDPFANKGARPPLPKIANPPKPLDYNLGPFAPLRGFIEANLDVVGVLDGRFAYIGPHTVQFDPTDMCPNDCIACWCRSPLLLDKLMPWEEQKQRLDLSILEDVLDDLVATGTKEIYIAGGGEPMAYPKILQLCESIKKRGLICNINTSFINVTKDVAHELARMKVDYMTVSVWAGTPETYVLTHPSKTEEAFWDLKEALTYLNEVKDVVPYIKTYHVLSNLNFHEMKKMVDFAIDTRSESIEWTLVDTMPDRTDSLLLSAEQSKWLYEEALRIKQWIVGDEKEARVHLFMFDQFLNRISGDHTTRGEHDRLVIDSMPCTVGWQFARVLANGNINSCLKSHRIPTGSLYQKRFMDIWTNEKQEEFREKTNVYTKADPWFSNIGNDPNAKCGCYKSCDDLGRIKHMYNRVRGLSRTQLAVLRAAQVWLRATGQYIGSEKMQPRIEKRRADVRARLSG